MCAECDFVPHHADQNPGGGRFGVVEGDHIVLSVVQLIDHFVKQGGWVGATRDYHPVDHVSFIGQGGPFPAHCVQGSAGSHFLPPIAAAMANGKTKAPDRVHVAFKAMHEHVDSFGGLPYFDGGENRISKHAATAPERGLGACVMGCSRAPWTGSLLLKQSQLEFALTEGQCVASDMDCPPDTFAVLDDGVDRQLASLAEKLKGFKRLFVCGLALDFCVLDTCLNAVGLHSEGLQFDSVYCVLDAARAAHITGIGSFGSGFLSDPKVPRRAASHCTSPRLAPRRASPRLASPRPLHPSLSPRAVTSPLALRSAGLRR